MPLQKAVNFLRQFRPDPFRRRDLLHGRFPEPIHGPKISEQQIFAVLTYARAIVENAFADALFHQELMIRVRKAVGFVANSLQ